MLWVLQYESYSLCLTRWQMRSLLFIPYESIEEALASFAPFAMNLTPQYDWICYSPNFNTWIKRFTTNQKKTSAILWYTKRTSATTRYRAYLVRFPPEL